MKENIMDEETKKNIENRRKKLIEILDRRCLVDEGCECGFWRSEHSDIGPAIGHGECLLGPCAKFRWNPKKKLKKGQETRGLLCQEPTKKGDPLDRSSGPKRSE